MELFWLGSYVIFCLRFPGCKSIGALFCIAFLSVIYCPTLADRKADIKVFKFEDSGSKSRQVLYQKIQGQYSKVGSVQTAKGNIRRVHHIPCKVDKDSRDRDKGLHDWIALFDFATLNSEDNSLANDTDCSVLEKVKTALFLGATAVIILTLNPKIIKELDVKQIFSCPVVYVNTSDNITAFLSALSKKMKTTVEITYNMSFYELKKITTLTLWSSCGRSSGVDYREWEGVVCPGQQEHSKEDPGQFWSIFFSSVVSFLLLLLMKAGHRADGSESLDKLELSLRHLAQESIRTMKTRRYPRVKFAEGDRDACAVCLDVYFPKQKLRVLPCFHEFHTKCVDPWLVKNRTCPLCKLNIIDRKYEK